MLSILQRLFERRMKLSEEVAAYKASVGMPVFDGEREEALLRKLKDRASDDQAAEAAAELYQTILRISRERQKELLGRQ